MGIERNSRDGLRKRMGEERRRKDREEEKSRGARRPRGGESKVTGLFSS